MADYTPRDIAVYGDDGECLYQGPLFYRCRNFGVCSKLITSKMISIHAGCPDCGGIQLVPAIKLTPEEIQALDNREIELFDWEAAHIYEEKGADWCTRV